MPVVAYLWTCAIEIPLVLLALRQVGWVRHAGIRRTIGVAWLVQFTQPALWFLGPRDLTWLVAAEVMVWLAEGVAIWALLRPRVPGARLLDALAAAVLANAASFAFGLAFPSLIG